MDIPEPLDLRSHTIAADKREALLKLFPEARTEGGKLDFDLLKRALGETVDAGRERYGMQWPGKADCFKAIQAPSMATLRPVPEESINFDHTQNLIIEGDNLQVLKLLQKGYQGKVKMIYIDPPYNTGKDFIYPDNYTEDLRTYLQYTGQVDAEGRKWGSNTDTDGRFHSKWLNMMYPRLYLARNLLREDGVMFVSIDDAEFDNLRKVGDEVFGEENFIGTAIWQHSIQPKGYSGKYSVHHNYIVGYRKSDHFLLANLERTDEHNVNYSNPDNDPKGPWRSGDVRNALYRPNLIYDIVSPTGEIIKPPKNGWRWSKETVQRKIASGEIKFSEDGKRIIRKIYLKTLEGRTPESIWFGKTTGTTRDAANELKALFDEGSPFDTPKPSALVKHMLSLGSSADDGDANDRGGGVAQACSYDIILDFFAGSGTTAQAVLEQNMADGGNRKFILVQLPEPTQLKDYKTIAEITKERVRRVIKKLEAEQAGKLQLEAKPDLGFRVYKLAESNFKPWDASVREPEALAQQMQLHVQHVLEGRTEQDLLAEIMLKSGFMLTAPVEEVMLEGVSAYDVNRGELLVCLSDALTHDALKAMAARQPQRAVCLDSGFQGNDQLKANAVQLFKAKGVVFRTV
jgi:adenine-specific DNA-methyltransferase